MPFPPEPLYYALFYLRCFLESFVISGLGLQIMGQSPRLSTLFKFSLLAGVLLFLLYLAPLGPAGLLTAIALVLILALRQTRQAGLFVTTAAVLLGLYLLVHVRWLLVQLRLFLDLPRAADLSRDFLPALLQEAPALLVPAALVCVVAFFQARARAASTLSTSASEKYSSRFRAVDKNPAGGSCRQPAFYCALCRLHHQHLLHLRPALARGHPAALRAQRRDHPQRLRPGSPARARLPLPPLLPLPPPPAAAPCCWNTWSS